MARWLSPELIGITAASTARIPDEEPGSQWPGSSDEPLRLIANNRGVILKSAKQNGVSPLSIATIIYQEKYKGRGVSEALDIVPEFNVRHVRRNIPWFGYGWSGKPWQEHSFGLGSIQVRTAARLMHKDITDRNQLEEVLSALLDDKKNIDLIAKYLAENQKAIGRELSPTEAARAHNAGIRGLRTYLRGSKGLKYVTARTKGHRKEIERALDGYVEDPVSNPMELQGYHLRP